MFLQKIEFHLVYPHLGKQILRKGLGNILIGYHSLSHAYQLRIVFELYSELCTALPWQLNAINQTFHFFAGSAHRNWFKICNSARGETSGSG